MLAKDASGAFVCAAHDGECKRTMDKSMPVNEKTIIFGLQAHSYVGGVIQAFRGDRGGQIYAMTPTLP